MTGNKIGDEGAQSVSETLQENTTVTSLDLGGQEIKGDMENQGIKLILNYRESYWR